MEIVNHVYQRIHFEQKHLAYTNAVNDKFLLIKNQLLVI